MTLAGNDSYAVDLLHMDGANNSTTFAEDPFINCKFPNIPILNFRKLNCGINDGDNEVLALGGAGTWDAGAIMHPCILQVGSTIYLYYAAHDAGGVYAIGLATVAVAGFTGKGFSKYGSTAIVTKGSGGSWNETGVDYPFVIYDAAASLWKMWFVGWNGAGTYAIGYATSSDGLAWTPYGSSAVLSPLGGWDGSILMSPCVLRESASSYKMLYSGNNPSPPGAQIGLATSSDGISWTPYASNPVIPKGAASSWNEYSSHGPRTLKKDPARGIYEVLFCGKPNDANKYSSLGYAHSTDLITWTQDTNPVMGPTKTWESHETENPSVLLLNYLNYVYYDTWYGSPSTIGLAIFGSPAHTWTYHGNAKIITADSKFGGACGSFPGGSDWIDTPDSEDFSFGSNPFTIDFWIKRGATGILHRICGQCNSTGTAASSAVVILIDAANKLNTYVGIGATEPHAISSGTIADTTTWHHIAVTRVGDTLYQYIDGTQDGSLALGAGAVINNSTNKFSIGRQGELASDYFNGKIDEFRISNGIARWTANFTVPSVAYGMDFPLAVDNLAHSHSLGTVALIYNILLAVAGLAHANSLGAVSLTQVHNLVVANLAHANAIDNVVLSQIHRLIVQALSHAHSIGSPALTQIHQLIVQSLNHAHSLDGDLVFALSILLVVEDLLHSHQIENGEILIGLWLEVQNLIHSHSLGEVSLSQNFLLIVQALQHRHSIDEFIRLIQTKPKATISDFYYKSLKLEAPTLEPDGPLSYERCSLNVPTLIQGSFQLGAFQEDAFQTSEPEIFQYEKIKMVN